MRALAGVSWEANPEALLMVHKGLVRAHLEWDAILFAGARGTLTQKLDIVQYSSLRAALGCIRTTPIPLLLSEANEFPLALRRTYL